MERKQTAACLWLREGLGGKWRVIAYRSRFFFLGCNVLKLIIVVRIVQLCKHNKKHFTELHILHLVDTMYGI